MNLATVATVLVWAALAQGCKNEPTLSGGEPAGAIDRSRLCLGGGATLNAATNECVCPPPGAWNGLRCETPGVATSVATGTAATPETPAAADGETAGSKPKAESEAPASAPGSAVGSTTPAEPAAAAEAAEGDDKALVAACHRAKGQWLAGDGYCLCPAGGVLVGSRCRTLPGVVTEAACRRAVHKGKWQNWRCECAAGLVFAPSRGGCVPRVQNSVAVLRRECESSLGRGKWDAAGGRCRCQEGRIWQSERCLPRVELNSREICESDDDGGKWDADHKRCRCPAGRVWLNQTCRAPTGVAPKELCESEAGGGQWNAQSGKCVCPGLRHWDEALKACDG